MNGREMDGGHLVLQNLETQEIKDLGIVGYKHTVANSYVEGLVLQYLTKQPMVQLHTEKDK